MTEFILNLCDATKLETGVYQWSFGTRNEIRPERLVVGPCSVTVGTDQREITVLSDSFRNDRKTHTLHGDNLQQILTVIHPEQRYTHASNGSSGTSSSSSAVTDTTIEGFSDLVIWIDLDPARTLDTAFATCSALGDLPMHLYSRLPTPSTLVLTANYLGELVYMNTTTQLLGLSRDTNPNQGHNQMWKDSTYPTAVWTDNFHVHHIWKSGATYTQTNGLWNLNNSECYVYASGNGVIKFKNSSNQNASLSVLSWIPNRVYITSLKRVYDTTTSSWQFHWRQEDVDVGVSSVVTEISDAGVAPSGSGSGWSVGIQGMYNRHVIGPLIGANGIDQGEFDNAIIWLKNWYGAESSSSSGESSSTSLDYQLLDTRKKTIDLNKPHETIKTVELEFHDHDGARIDPVSCVIHISAN